MYTRKQDDITTHIGWYTDANGNSILDIGAKILCSDGTIVKMR
jgi:hypothetical protein